MEFWGVEVPSGQPVQCAPGELSYIHVSQAALGAVEKNNERVLLKIKSDDKEIVIGTLSSGKCDQLALDLIFDKDFSISHSGSSAITVYFAGYRTDATREEQFLSDDEISDEEDDEEEEEEADLPTPVQISAKENGKIKKSEVAIKEAPKQAVTPIPEKADASKAKAKGGEAKSTPKAADVKAKSDDKAIAKAKADDLDEESDDEDDDDEDELMLSTSGESEDDFGSDESDDDEDDGSDDESEDSEEEQPAIAGKKRPFSGTQKAPLGKKNKLGTPQGETKPGKKEIETPKSAPQKQQQQSAKKDKKTPGKDNLPTTPNSGKKLGQYTCAPCNKNFTTESGLTQHKAAKHK